MEVFRGALLLLIIHFDVQLHYGLFQFFISPPCELIYSLVVD